MTSFIAAGGSGRSTSVIPAVPAASSVTTIAFMGIVSSLITRPAESRLRLQPPQRRYRRSSKAELSLGRQDDPLGERGEYAVRRGAVSPTAVSVRLVAGAPVALVDHARAERSGLDQVHRDLFGDWRQVRRAATDDD